jgi:hypothetical protein
MAGTSDLQRAAVAVQALDELRLNAARDEQSGSGEADLTDVVEYA